MKIFCDNIEFVIEIDEVLEKILIDEKVLTLNKKNETKGYIKSFKGETLVLILNFNKTNFMNKKYLDKIKRFFITNIKDYELKVDNLENINNFLIKNIKIDKMFNVIFRNEILKKFYNYRFEVKKVDISILLY